jgi:hypothetical protein
MDIYSTASSSGHVDYFIAPDFRQAKEIAQQIVGKRIKYIAVVSRTNLKYHRAKRYLGL